MRELKKFKFLFFGIIRIQYPKMDLKPKVSKFTDKEFNNSNAELNCFISWKSTRLTRTHAKAYLDFIEINDNVKFWFFDDVSQDTWMSENYGNHEIHSIYKGIKFAASRSDVFRLCILYKYGGVYTGINRTFNQKLTNIFAQRDKFIVSFEQNAYFRSSNQSQIPKSYRNLNMVQHSIFSPPGHKILKMAIDRVIVNAPLYNRVKFESVKEAIWKFSAPYMLTDVIDDYLETHGTEKITFCGIQFDESSSIPQGSEFRYASSPSYLGSRNRVILDLGSK
jgi:mannosyltransferase OCH1-like enzyme